MLLLTVRRTGSLLYCLDILTWGIRFVNRILQEIFNIFLQDPMVFSGSHKDLLLIEFGEGALIRTVQETVKNRAHQTADHEYHPDQPVVVGGGDQ